jgi:hypothetical protein
MFGSHKQTNSMQSLTYFDFNSSCARKKRKLSKTNAKDFLGSFFSFSFRFCRYRDPCSLSLNEDDNHTITLVGNANKKAVTLAKTCEQVNELRDCRAPRDWSILALQNTRTGKSHYLVICKCPSNFRLGELVIFWNKVFGSSSNWIFMFFFRSTEGPLPHDQPTYAGLPGINVYGMLCVPQTTSANTFSQWKISQRPAIHTSYRTRNTTIEASSDPPAAIETSSEK